MASKKKNKTVTERQLRKRVARFVVISNAVLYFSTFVYYILKGIDGEEMMVIMGFLSPITSVYLTAIFKYAVATRHPDTENLSDRTVSGLYVTLTNWAIPLHFFILFLAISLKALFNLVSFSDLKVIFTVVESLFGAYVGLIITSLYKSEENNEAAAA